jgi:hypothetical protein
VLELQVIFVQRRADTTGGKASHAKDKVAVGSGEMESEKVQARPVTGM